MTALALTLSLTSCSDDNDVQDVYYTLGFEQLSGGNEVFSEMYRIENAFKAEIENTFGIAEVSFHITGTIEECDAKVKEACQRTAKSLDGEEWAGYFVYVATNANTGETVYSVTFGQK